MGSLLVPYLVCTVHLMLVSDVFELFQECSISNCLDECNTLHSTLQYDTLRAMLASSRLLQMSEMFLALCWIRKNKKEGERRGNLESLIKAATHNSKITREIERDKDNKQDIINIILSKLHGTFQTLKPSVRK